MVEGRTNDPKGRIGGPIAKLDRFFIKFYFFIDKNKSFSLKMLCINENDKKFLLYQSNQQSYEDDIDHFIIFFHELIITFIPCKPLQAKQVGR